ncbi:MAG: serine/threonine protein kinase [Planctomycetes bacterium]|nr:serine/threonine protein kinase [Planctomycetota bacterium]
MNEDAPTESLDDRLDRLVSEYSDRLAAGQRPNRREYLDRLPAGARPGFERVLKMIEAGMASPPSRIDPLVPGAEFGQYRLEREVGRGGMALVWLARDTKLGRPVALKLLRPGLALEQRHVDRFEREARAIAKLHHPHIVEVHDVGEARGYHYLAMEFVAGPSLATVFEALPIDRERTADDLARATGIAELAQHGSFEQAIARLLVPVVDALSHAHELGIVHRDVKPSNILLQMDGRAVIADFGLAKGDDDPSLSLTGEGIGTPYYMSPEQAHLTTKRVDHRTDIYSLGVTLYEALAGRRPFGGQSFLEVVAAIRDTVPVPLRTSTTRCSRNAAAVVRCAMARDPDERYRDADALRLDLVAVADGLVTEARQAEGGVLRRVWTALRRTFTGESFEYRSEATLFGVPLVHWIAGRRRPGQPRRVARGWLACGDTAYGLVALGPLAVGGICAGGANVGLVTWGGMTAGLLAFGGIAAGLFTAGGIAVGWLVGGGIACGYAAMGGIPIGHYALGGMPIGKFVLGDQRQDVEAREFFQALFESWDGFWSTLF